MLRSFLVIVLINLCGGLSVRAQKEMEESGLKAAFIYNFTKYIEWNADSSDIFSIGVFGSSPIYESLKEISATKTVSNKKIVLKHFTNPEEITFCNVLFISANGPFPLASILSKTGKGTLTIGEQEGYAEEGTAFNFVVANDKLKFEANVKSIIAAGLKASSQLLKLARIVD
jgi:hypothetical protein